MTAAAAELPRGGGGPVLRPAYLGPDHVAARFSEQRAREAGLTVTQAKVIGHVGSRKDFWAFRRTIAEAVDCSIRTVARAFRRAIDNGLMRTARNKPDEIPPGAEKPFACGWSHRWIIGREMAGSALQEAVAAAKLAAVARRAAKPPAAQRRPKTWRPLSDEQRQKLAEIDADSRAREQPPPD